MEKLIEILSNSDTNLCCEETSAESKNIIGKLRYAFIVGDKQNLNKRTYPASLLKREISRFKKRLSESNVAGTLDHPNGIHSELQKVSHIITDVTWDENSQKGIATSAILNTTKGKNLKVLLDSKVPLGASVRGRGTCDSSGKVQDDYSLLSIDLVSAPSFGPAVEVSKANLIESGNQFLGRTLTEGEILLERYSFALSAGFKGSFEDYKEKMNIGDKDNDKNKNL